MSIKTHDLSDGNFDLKTTERGLLLTVRSGLDTNESTYHTYIPRVRDCHVLAFGATTTTIKVGNVFRLRIKQEDWETTGKSIMTAALGNGWEG
jgi:hypothetical protein